MAPKPERKLKGETTMKQIRTEKKKKAAVQAWETITSKNKECITFGDLSGSLA